MEETTTTPAPAAGVTTVEGNKGSVATLPTFAEQLDGSLKNDERLSQWYKTQTEAGKKGTLSDLVNDHFLLGETHKSLQGEVEGRVKVPGEKSTPEDHAAFRKALGIPEAPDGYKLDRPKDMPEGMEYDELLEKTFRETAHKLDLTPTQVAGLFEMYNSREIGIYSGIEKIKADNKEKAITALKDTWKQSYDENKTKATKTFFETLKRLNPPEAFGGAEGIEKEFTEAGFGDNPVMVWYFSQLHDLVSIDKLGGGGGPAGGGGSNAESGGSLEFPSMEGKK